MSASPSILDHVLARETTIAVLEKTIETQAHLIASKDETIRLLRLSVKDAATILENVAPLLVADEPAELLARIIARLNEIANPTP